MAENITALATAYKEADKLVSPSRERLHAAIRQVQQRLFAFRRETKFYDRFQYAAFAESGYFRIVDVTDTGIDVAYDDDEGFDVTINLPFTVLNDVERYLTAIAVHLTEERNNRDYRERAVKREQLLADLAALDSAS